MMIHFLYEYNNRNQHTTYDDNKIFQYEYISCFITEQNYIECLIAYDNEIKVVIYDDSLQHLNDINIDNVISLVFIFIIV